MSDQLKIHILIDSLAGGGAERMIVALSGYLSEHGFAVTVVTLYSRERDFFDLEPRVDRAYLDLVATNSIFDKVVVNLRRILSFRAIIKCDAPDLVIGMMTACAILSVLATMRLPTRVIVSERNYPGRKKVFRAWTLLRKLLYRFADGHVAQTREAAAWIEQHVAGRNIHVIPNSVVWPIPASEPIVDLDECLAKGSQYILAVGTKVEQKGFDLLIDAFAHVANDYPDWKLVILGVADGSSKVEGPRCALRDQADNAGVGNRVYMPGLVGNVADWYEHAEIFVLSSRYEGFPNVLLEAMAAGCPCISFDCDAGPRDIIEHEVNGLLVSAEDVDALSTGMDRLMADHKLRERLAVQSQYVRSRFAEARILKQWCDVINEVARPSSVFPERSEY